jgi:uncharacterized membrane protein YfcA
MTLFYIVIGLLAGVVSGLFGIGGGVLIVSAMVVLLRVPILEATGTSLAALLLPVGLLGAIEYHRSGNVLLVPAALIAGGLFLGTWLGARWAHTLGPVALQRMFAVFLLVMAVRLWLSAKPDSLPH